MTKNTKKQKSYLYKESKKKNKERKKERVPIRCARVEQ